MKQCISEEDTFYIKGKAKIREENETRGEEEEG
jgi:hypothetical protein